MTKRTSWTNTPGARERSGNKFEYMSVVRVPSPTKAASSEELASTFSPLSRNIPTYHGHPMAIEAASSALRASSSMGTYLTCVLARRDGRTRADK